ncbi:MAG: hypothetical protein NTX50_25360 [Candidatus Sumerlaeota bacterium]|nr:hypothetical protein [Candidatus Sumerlaeota bacterium]
MNPSTQLQNRRDEIIKELASLPPMRKGSITQQWLQTVRKDGSKTRRGPYLVYSYKDKNKTISKRVPRQQEDLYRRQIESFRRFQKLSAELVQISQRLADRAASDPDDSKKNSRG